MNRQLIHRNLSSILKDYGPSDIPIFARCQCGKHNFTAKQLLEGINDPNASEGLKRKIQDLSDVVDQLRAKGRIL